MRNAKIASAFLVAAALSLLGSPAFSHGVVEERTPAPNSVVQESPVKVSVTADSLFLGPGGAQRGIDIFLKDSEGLFYGENCVEIFEFTASKVIALGQAGTYTVVYQAISADGHMLSDSYTFVFEPDSDHKPTSGNAAPLICGGAETPRDPDDTLQFATEQNDSGYTQADATAQRDGLSLVAVLLVVVAVGAAAIVVTRKPRT